MSADSMDYALHVSEGKIVAFQIPDSPPVYFAKPQPLDKAAEAAQKVEEFRDTFQMSANNSDSMLISSLVSFFKSITTRQLDEFIRPMAEAGKEGVPKASFESHGPSLAGLQATITLGLKGRGLKALWEKYYASNGERYYKIRDDYLQAVREALKLV